VTRILIVGGSDAGASAAMRAREIDPGSQVDVLVADRWPHYSICGLPYLLSGEVSRPCELAHVSEAELDAARLAVHLEHRAVAVDADAGSVVADTPEGTRHFDYDQLILATGAVPVRPPIRGLDDDAVHLLHTMDDALAVQARLDDPGTRRAVIVGAGYIGLEMADALRHRDLSVTVVEALPEVMPTTDPQVGELVHAELERHSVEVLIGSTVSAIVRSATGLEVRGAKRDLEADLVLVVAGVRPQTELGTSIDLGTGAAGAIDVDQRMATSLAGVWAAGDCVHTHHRLLPSPTYSPLGTTAHKQGRVAGENAAGGTRRFDGVLGTQVVKVFGLWRWPPPVCTTRRSLTACTRRSRTKWW
jgi:NADPH-dependent 2,4-dienoyl-CoA reductase/sulfur reductase-like enzyme